MGGSSPGWILVMGGSLRPMGGTIADSAQGMEVNGVFLVMGVERHLVMKVGRHDVGGRWVRSLWLYWGLHRSLLFLQSSGKFMVNVAGLRCAV